jgi:hypothetical protein
MHGLSQHGVPARHIAQEHSFVSDMWLKIAKPDELVFLDVSFLQATLRRQLNWGLRDYLEERRRLQHALRHADLYLFTDNLNPKQILALVMNFIAAISAV